MSEIRLDGCATSPLASYLKALGVLRLVGEQADPHARGAWSQVFTLDTSLSEDELCSFFLDTYMPSPVVSPWNSDGGFSRDGKRTSEKVLTAISGTSDGRLETYRQAIFTGWELVDDSAWAAQSKGERVNTCRNWLPDEALPWLDASVVLSEGEPSFPPLLGTGGNLGRMEISSNYMQRLGDALGVPVLAKRSAPRERRVAWLRQALFGRGTPKPVSGGIGQYDPGLAAHGKVNPWDFVLLIEGALLLASGIAQRAASAGRGTPAMPFTVTASPVGYATATEGEDPRAELWLPVWRGPMGVEEARRLFQEGRLRLGRRIARTGLDAARAAASLGADRGIDSFARYVFVERFGQGIFAVDAGRLSVRERPETGLFSSLDGWLNRLRRIYRSQPLPDHLAALLRSVEQAEFAVAGGAGPDQLLELLAAVARLERGIGRSGALRAQIRPLAQLRADEWLPHIYRGTIEFRLAAAFASLRGKDGTGLRHLLRPVQRTRTGLEWRDRGAPVAGFGHLPLLDVLAEVHTTRMIQRSQEHVRPPGGREPRPDDPAIDVRPPAYEYGRRAVPADLAALLDGRVDLDELQRYLTGLLIFEQWKDDHDTDESGLPPDPLWRFLAPFHYGSPLKVGDVKVTLGPGPAWARQLRDGQLADVLHDATRKLRAAHLTPLIDPRHVTHDGMDTTRLSAALLLRVPFATARASLRCCTTDELPLLKGAS